MNLPEGVDVSRGNLYVVLRQEILAGNPPPGSPLHEVKLSTQLGVSRAPVREALLRLESDGLVERGPRGAKVRVRTPEEIYDIYEVRIALEELVVEAALKHATELDLARLVMMHDDAMSEKDPRCARQLHAQWHHTLAAASRNSTLVEVLGRLAGQLAPYETQSLAEPGNLSQTHDEHLEIIEAIKKQDAKTARSLIRQHLRRTRDVRVNALLADERR
ncbi:Putative L-lactate dehydrogenase operon regulatory protein [Corynebacterium provencense]|uniref:L-lactate dehydrogenase operon regulatory protein n=1 Tax=Corynebacterium provencense TaxID=1737425 RepID=A0A2Z3YR73_9CORY|nr:GntR family transcriptional regulator [Corynebacterium provencense]AWT26739.1 Putative L-lactate dehydrogenase operon regulatory protein [Corynebacterium provencense]